MFVCSSPLSNIRYSAIGLDFLILTSSLHEGLCGTGGWRVPATRTVQPRWLGLRQDNVGLGIATLLLELGSQEVPEPARERAARAAVEGQPQDEN